MDGQTSLDLSDAAHRRYQAARDGLALGDFEYLERREQAERFAAGVGAESDIDLLDESDTDELLRGEGVYAEAVTGTGVEDPLVSARDESHEFARDVAVRLDTARLSRERDASFVIDYMLDRAASTGCPLDDVAAARLADVVLENIDDSSLSFEITLPEGTLPVCDGSCAWKDEADRVLAEWAHTSRRCPFVPEPYGDGRDFQMEA